MRHPATATRWIGRYESKELIGREKAGADEVIATPSAMTVPTLRCAEQECAGPHSRVPCYSTGAYPSLSARSTAGRGCSHRGLRVGNRRVHRDEFVGTESSSVVQWLFHAGQRGPTAIGDEIALLP